ncbi:hypothetical protein [Rhizobium leguminosarum]|uniref:hypothetical protein n=1 Tax=Rhizobium leguminosarum TaxID=384 RepID=UPI0013B66130|nr:hypothetical protein [Rhizobium leguminosarum]NEI60951.1 hypothetical protein [Rhizobium leguminosarum]
MADTLLTTCWQELISKDGRPFDDYHGMALITRDELQQFLHLAAFKWDEERRHGISVEELRDLDGGLMGYWTKGHHPLHHFQEAANYYSGADARYDERYIADPSSIRHEWWRTTPVGGEPGMVQYLPAEPRSRGAFAVTVSTIVEDRDIKRSTRDIAEHHRAAARGFADGLNWALRQLERINSSAGDDLLKFYRDENKKERSHVS